MSKYDAVVNQKNGLSVKNSPGCHCKVTGIVYAIHCKKCKLLYTRETGETMFDRYSGHKYDIKKRPDNCGLAKPWTTILYYTILKVHGQTLPQFQP